MTTDRRIAEALTGSWRYLTHSTYLSARGCTRTLTPEANENIILHTSTVSSGSD